MERNLFFCVPDLHFPCIKESATSTTGERAELAGRRPSDLLRGAITLPWKSGGVVPDFLHHASLALLVSEKARGCLVLEESSSMALRQLVLVDGRKRTLRSDYWWVDVKEEHLILDEGRSVVERAGRAVLRIPEYRVDWRNVPALDLFVCRTTFALVVSSEFVQRYRFSSLTGASFASVDGGSWPARPRDPEKGATH